MTATVSAVVVNWNTKDYLRECLHSLQETAANELKEVIVVDNASSDGSAEMVAAEFPDAVLLRNDVNTAYAAANNQGAGAATGIYLLLLNPDTRLLDNAVTMLRRFLDAHPDAAAVAPRLVNPDGGVQQSVRTFPGPVQVLTEATGLRRLAPGSRVLGGYRMGWWDQTGIREVDQPMTSCLLIRRHAWNELGGMDESFPLFFNDVDLCFRLKLRGGRVYFLPGAQVVHHVGASTRQVRPEMITASHLGLERFYRKHYRGRVPSWLYLFVLSVNRLALLVRLGRERLTRR